jgi:pimeloyl-ACP methyl ester carboxylesterase
MISQQRANAARLSIDNAMERGMKRQTRFFSYIGLFALFLGLLGALPAFSQPGAANAQASDEEVTGKLEDRLCPVIGPPGETEGKDYYCGLMYVPENYDEPDGKQIQISYAVLKSKSLSPLPDPVVYLSGGPGGSAITGLSWYAEIFADMRLTRDVIVYDQRGTKYSSRLNCDPFLYLLNYLINNDEEVAADFDEIQSLTEDEAMPGVIAEIYMSACAEGLVDAGYDLTQYNSRVSVMDLFALTNSLGYDEVNLYGISYGTRLALAAMQHHPQQIRSVVLDSVYPPNVNGVEWFPRQLDEVLVNLVEACENDDECNEAFPDFHDQLARVISAAADDPKQLAGWESLLSFMNWQPELAEYIPLMIDELLKGNDDILQAIIDGDLPAEEPQEDVPGQQDDLLIEAQQLQETAEQLFVQAALEAQENRPGAVWMRNVSEAMDDLSSEENELAAIALMIVLMMSPEPDVALLEEFVNSYLPRASRKDLVDELGDLDAVELQYVYDLIGDLSDSLPGSGGASTDGMYYSVECNEEAPFNDLDIAEEAIEDLEFPEFGVSGLALSEQIMAICSIWPSGEADPIETEPVVSDIPTLILSGDWDIQTPPSWGGVVLDGLSNGTWINAPMSGHGIIRYSQCATNIATTFVAGPTVTLNTDCIADLAPNFVTLDELPQSQDQTADDEDTGNEDTGDDEDRPTGSRELWTVLLSQ